MASTGQSYQKYDGASGTYQTLGTNDSDINGSSNGGRRGPMKWVYGAVALVVIAGVYFLTAPRVSPGKAVDKAIAGDKNIAVNANGRLQLFDELSKSLP